MTNNDEKLRDLEGRISNLEKRSPEYSSGFAKKLVYRAIAILLGIMLVLMVIGVIQFVSAG
ncbi:MAG: hypothetical protein K6T94_08475 [Paenibacillus sp.]|nr:hypothetical protein [Paenibacillus sp.]